MAFSGKPRLPTDYPVIGTGGRLQYGLSGALEVQRVAADKKMDQLAKEIAADLKISGIRIDKLVEDKGRVMLRPGNIMGVELKEVPTAVERMASLKMQDWGMKMGGKTLPTKQEIAEKRMEFLKESLKEHNVMERIRLESDLAADKYFPGGGGGDPEDKGLSWQEAVQLRRDLNALNAKEKAELARRTPEQVAMDESVKKRTEATLLRIENERVAARIALGAAKAVEKKRLEAEKKEHSDKLAKGRAKGVAQIAAEEAAKEAAITAEVIARAGTRASPLTIKAITQEIASRSGSPQLGGRGSPKLGGSPTLSSSGSPKPLGPFKL